MSKQKTVYRMILKKPTILRKIVFIWRESIEFNLVSVYNDHILLLHLINKK